MSSFLRSSESEDQQTSNVVMEAYYDKTIPLTTRPKRDAEIADLDYHFVSDSFFDEKQAQDAFIEWGEHNGFKYGTLKIDPEVAISIKEDNFSRKSAIHETKMVGEATIAQLMGNTDWAETEAFATFGALAVTTFLRRVDPADDKYGRFRKAVKVELSKVTVPYTTRALRMGELEGEHYHFVTDEVFDGLVAGHKLFEFAEMNGVRYGSPKILSTDIGFSHTALPGSTVKQRPARHLTMQKIHEVNAEELTVWDLLGQQATEDDILMRTPRKELSKNVSGFMRMPPAQNDGTGLEAKLRARIAEKVEASTVKYTTRARQDGEIDGMSFYFVDQSVFEAARAEGVFLTVSTDADGNLVGTPAPIKGQQAPWVLHGSIMNSKPLTLGMLVEDNKVPWEFVPSAAPEKIKDVPLAMIHDLTAGYSEYAELNTRVKAVIENITVPLTTRPRKMNEVPGVDYHFISREHFDMLQSLSHLYEGGEFNGHMYGLRIPCEADLANAKRLLDQRAEQATTPQLRAIIDNDEILPRKSIAEQRKVGNGDEPSVADLCATFGISDVPSGEWATHTASSFVASYPQEGDYAGVADTIASLIQTRGSKLTTRERRLWELDGREYEFCSDEQFKKMIEGESFFTFDNIDSDWYGCMKLRRSDVDGTSLSYDENLVMMFGLESEITVGQLLGDATIININGQSVGGIAVSQFIEMCTNNNEHGIATDNGILAAIDSESRLINPLITTRQPMPHELQNAEFIFTSEDVFEDLLGKEYFMEHTRLVDTNTGARFRQAYLRIFNYEDIPGKKAKRADLFMPEEAGDTVSGLGEGEANDMLQAIKHRLGSFVDTDKPQALASLVEEITDYLEVGEEQAAARRDSELPTFLGESDAGSVPAMAGLTDLAEGESAFPDFGETPEVQAVVTAASIAAKAISRATFSLPTTQPALPAFPPQPMAGSQVDTAAIANSLGLQMDHKLAALDQAHNQILRSHTLEMQEKASAMDQQVKRQKTLNDESAELNAQLKETLASMQAATAAALAEKGMELAAKEAAIAKREEELAAKAAEQEAAAAARSASLEEVAAKKEEKHQEEKDLVNTSVKHLHAHIKKLEQELEASNVAAVVAKSFNTPAKMSPVKARMAARKETLQAGSMTPITPQTKSPSEAPKWQRAKMMVNVATTISPLKAKLAARRRARAETSGSMKQSQSAGDNA